MHIFEYTTTTRIFGFEKQNTILWLSLRVSFYALGTLPSSFSYVVCKDNFIYKTVSKLHENLAMNCEIS